MNVVIDNFVINLLIVMNLLLFELKAVVEIEKLSMAKAARVVLENI